MFPVLEQNISQPFHRLRRHIGSAMSLKLSEIPNTQTLEKDIVTTGPWANTECEGEALSGMRVSGLGMFRVSK